MHSEASALLPTAPTTETVSNAPLAWTRPYMDRRASHRMPNVYHSIWHWYKVSCLFGAEQAMKTLCQPQVVG